MKVYIHANCQARPLGEMLREARPDWDVAWVEAHTDEMIEQIDRYRARIKTADVVISQPIHNGYRGREELSLDWVRANVRPGATLIVIPYLHFEGHHPGLELSLFGLPNRLEYSLVGHLMAHGVAADQIVQLLLSDDILRPDDIRGEIEAALDAARRLEIGADIQMMPFLEKHCWARPMFHVTNHPLRPIVAYMANQVLDQLGAPERASVVGPEYQTIPHVPPLPAIARFLRDGEGEGSVVMFNFKPMTMADFFRLTVERLAEIPPAQIFKALEERWPSVLMFRRLAERGAPVPGIERWRAR